MFRRDVSKMLEEIDLQTMIRTAKTRRGINRNRTTVDIHVRATLMHYDSHHKTVFAPNLEVETQHLSLLPVSSVQRPRLHRRHISADTAARHARFERTWKVIKQELLDYITGEDMPNDAIEWYERNLDYSVFGGKLNRCMSVVGTAKIIKGLTDDEHLKAAVLGWGIELLQAFFLISDDMMDSFITRCWHRVPKVCQITINDSFMLEAAIYYLLKEHFLGRATVLIFWSFSGDDVPDGDGAAYRFDRCSARHSLIVLYKISHYSFYLPVALAVYMSHVPQSHPSGNQAIEPYASLNPSSSPSASIIIQDDFLD
ncbi:terpenoid synthase [Armillaria gallica]|uniref:Terpenoid synthase n=1 Tax=Armillaria gallica TaxID=47427 RepID=A0A2H3CYC6_ARMGA|nr:terpenoid synthase [Armillaria gallica]